MADTIGYIQVKMKAVTLQLARTHARFTHCARDEIINSLRSALRASLREELIPAFVSFPEKPTKEQIKGFRDIFTLW